MNAFVPLVLMLAVVSGPGSGAGVTGTGSGVLLLARPTSPGSPRRLP